MIVNYVKLVGPDGTTFLWVDSDWIQDDYEALRLRVESFVLQNPTIGIACSWRQIIEMPWLPIVGSRRLAPTCIALLAYRSLVAHRDRDLARRQEHAS